MKINTINLIDIQWVFRPSICVELLEISLPHDTSGTQPAIESWPTFDLWLVIIDH